MNILALLVCILVPIVNLIGIMIIIYGSIKVHKNLDGVLNDGEWGWPPAFAPAKKKVLNGERFIIYGIIIEAITSLVYMILHAVDFYIKFSI